MDLNHFRCFEEHASMPLHSLGALCQAPGRAGSIWVCLEAVVGATGVSERCAYGIQTEFHFADEVWLEVRL
jgi:hypothetical protein